VVDALRAEYGEIVFRTVIRENVRLAEASAYAQPITTYDSTSNGAADYRTLAAEVIAQEEQHA
jgi:chromosome partitioning protein